MTRLSESKKQQSIYLLAGKRLGFETVNKEVNCFPPGPGVGWRREAFWLFFPLGPGVGWRRKSRIFINLGPGVVWRRACKLVVVYVLRLVSSKVPFVLVFRFNG